MHGTKLVGIALLVSACGGGGSSGNQQPSTPPPPPPPPTVTNPAFNLTFPLGSSTTDQAQIPFQGFASTASGVSMVSVSSSGTIIQATEQADGSWRVPSLALQSGQNQFTVEITDDDGNTGQTDFEVRRQLVFTTPTATAYDSSDSLLYVLDRGQQLLFAIDETSNTTDLVSGSNRGAGPLWNFPSSIVVDANGNLLVLDGGLVIQVDPQSGDRTELFARQFGIPFFSAMTMDATLNRLYLVAPNTGGLWKFDIGQDTQAGQIGNTSLNIASPVLSAAFAGAWNRVLATDFQGSVYSLDIATGDGEQLFSVSSLAQGLLSIAFDSTANEIVLLTANGNLQRYDQTGTNLGAISTDAGMVLGAQGLSVNGDTLYFVSQSTTEVFAVNSSTGASTILATSQVGSGELLTALQGGKSGGDGLLLYGVTSVVRLDPLTGARTLVGRLSPPLISAIGFFGDGLPNGFDISNDETTAWSTTFSGETLLSSNLTTGQTSILSSQSVGQGPNFELITGIAINEATNVAFVSDAGGTNSRVLEVSLASGDRTEIWTASKTAVGSVRDIVLDIANSGLLLDLDGPASFPIPGQLTDQLILSIALDGSGESTLAEIAADQVAESISLLPARQSSLAGDGSALYSLLDQTAAGTLLRTPLDAMTPEIIPQGGGPFSVLPVGVIQGEHNRLYKLDLSGAVFLVDQSTGQQVLVSR